MWLQSCSLLGWMSHTNHCFQLAAQRNVAGWGRFGSRCAGPCSRQTLQLLVPSPEKSWGGGGWGLLWALSHLLLPSDRSGGQLLEPQEL